MKDIKKISLKENAGKRIKTKFVYNSDEISKTRQRKYCVKPEITQELLRKKSRKSKFQALPLKVSSDKAEWFWKSITNILKVNWSPEDMYITKINNKNIRLIKMCSNKRNIAQPQLRLLILILFGSIHMGTALFTGCYSPAGNYMFKLNNRNTRIRWEICSKLTIKTPERPHWHRSGVLIANFEHISLCSSVSIVNFEQVKAGWIAYLFSQAHSQISSCHNRTHIPPNFPNFR